MVTILFAFLHCISLVQNETLDYNFCIHNKTLNLHDTMTNIELIRVSHMFLFWFFYFATEIMQISPLWD